MKEIKVFLVDDQEIFREGLARLLQEQTWVHLVQHCRNSLQLPERIEALEPDVLLIDIDTTLDNSPESFQRISRVSPKTRIAVFTENHNKNHFIQAMQMGARGYISKDVPVDELMASINLIARGEVVISPYFSQQFLFSALRKGNKPAAATDQESLSEREIEVLRLVTSGATNREIAGKLFIAENTVKVHLKKIQDKLHLRNRQQLAVYAVQQGLTLNLQR